MTQLLNLALGVVLVAVLVIFLLIFLNRRGKGKGNDEYNDIERKQEREKAEEEKEELVSFQGGQDLTIVDILEAPGEVIGKANHGTLYKAYLQGSNTVRLLRFLRPVCTAGLEDFVSEIEFLGSIRHPNLVPLLGFYSGPRAEKLLIHPFYRRGNLAQFIRGKQNPWSLCFSLFLHKQWIFFLLDYLLFSQTMLSLDPINRIRSLFSIICLLN